MKTIITLDKANQPYGFPQLDGNGELSITSITGSLSGTASFAVTASYALNPQPVIGVKGTTLYSITPPAGTNSSTENSIFFGFNAGNGATDAANSNFIGVNAGDGATNAYQSNFIGINAGKGATNANLSHFLGGSAGEGATNSNSSNFIGTLAGYNALNAVGSNFIGIQAGGNTTSTVNSNFIGVNAGFNATDAAYSNFIGQNAGFSATRAQYSNFIGLGAGRQATSASYSTLIGYQVGYNVAGGALGIASNNIIIGTNITLPNGTRNSINLGAIIFASGSYSTTTGNPFSGSVGNGRVGINQPTPTQALDVSGSVQISQVLVLPPQNPLPSGRPTGSFAVSGSGVDCKPYFWNGATWTALF